MRCSMKAYYKPEGASREQRKRLKETPIFIASSLRDAKRKATVKATVAINTAFAHQIFEPKWYKWGTPTYFEGLVQQTMFMRDAIVTVKPIDSPPEKYLITVDLYIDGDHIS